MTGTLRITRADGRMDKLRSYDIRVDGQPRADIARNRDVEITLPAGTYSVAAHLDWCRSPAVDIRIEDGQVTALRVSNPWSSGLALIAITFGRKRYLKLEPEPAVA